MRALLLAAGLAIGAAACAPVRNPATGEVQYTSLSAEEERALGRAEHPKAVQQFGGSYDDPALQAFVERVGVRVKNASELSSESFTFTVLDSEVVNAFALPGGYVYVTRGLLALANDEAEVAGVLGHEIGHITARHTAQRYDRAQLGQLGAVASQLGGLVLGNILGGAEVGRLGAQAGGRLGSLGAQAYVQGFSREQEFQADQLGIRYLAAAGYDPGAMATFLGALQANDAFAAREPGEGEAGAGLFRDLLRSHPRTPDRVARAAVEEQADRPAARELGRPAMLAAIENMIYGENPAQGVVRGRSFEHPDLRIAFEAPAGFRLSNTPAAVVGADPEGRVMRFDLGEDAGGDLRDYIQNGWAKGQRLQDLQDLTVNGQEAALAFGQVAINQRPGAAMLAAVRGPGGRVYRLLYARAGNLSRADIAAFEASLRSFRPLAASEAASIQPRRLVVVPVRAGDTVEGFARRMDVEEDPRGLFVLLNGLDRGRSLEPGGSVKLVRRAGAA